MDGVEEHIKPARYHTSGDGTPCIVYTDFGADLIDILDAEGRLAARRCAAIPRSIPATDRDLRHTEASLMQLRCPICNSAEFLAFNGRDNARCKSCQAMERTRLLWMILEKHNLFRPGLRVMHLAPELPIAKRYRAAGRAVFRVRRRRRPLREHVHRHSPARPMHGSRQASQPMLRSDHP